MEEERRLAFVAMTRAQRGLFLSEAGGRGLDGSPRYPSRFILDIDQSLLDYTSPPERGLIEETRDYIRAASARLAAEDALPAFAEGDRVRHSVFGPGTVRSIDYARRAYLVEFDSVRTPRAIAFRAPLSHLE